MPDESDRIWIDSNGVPTERRCLGGQEVIVQHEDIRETDITVHQGIRVTTPLRMVIDIAPDVALTELERIVRDCLDRRPSTVHRSGGKGAARRSRHAHAARRRASWTGPSLLTAHRWLARGGSRVGAIE